MDNPTREEVKLYRLGSHCCLMCDKIAKAYLCALDMRDALKEALQDDGRNEGITKDGYPYWIAGRIQEEIKKFDADTVQ